MNNKIKTILIFVAIAAFFAADNFIAHNNFIVNSNKYIQNDFEITQHDHPEKVWDKVLFGNSVVISAYMEKNSNSGYINCGLDYGVAEDLWKMISQGYIHIGSNLVVGLNYLTLYDDFDTNPTYIWHKKPYQPYAYFERDRFYPMITGCFERLINGESVSPMIYTYQNKAVYHGRVADDALQEKFDEYQNEFFNQPIEKFSKNITALEKIIKYCKKHNIRMRVVWMPWNPMFEQPQIIKDVRTKTDSLLNAYGIEILDFENKYPQEYFYDTGHLNYDAGAEIFTADIDQWLNN